MKKTLFALLAIAGVLVSCSKNPTEDPKPADSVSLNKTAVELEIGATETLVATANNDLTVAWASSAEAVATVKDGVVTAVAAGEATITATAGTASATCKVTVKAPAPKVEDTALDLTLGVSYNYNFAEPATSNVWTAEVKFLKKGDWNEDGMSNRLIGIFNLQEKGIMLRFNDDGGKHVGSAEWGLLQVISEATGNFYIGRNEGSEGPQKCDFAEGGQIEVYKFLSETWYTLSFVNDGAKMYVYCNGELLCTLNDAAYEFSFQRLEIGMSWTDGGEHDSKTGYPARQAFKGNLGYVRFWSKALTESEIKAGLCSVDPKSEGLEVDLVFNAGEGTVVEDATGKGHNIDFSKGYYYKYSEYTEVDASGNVAWIEAIEGMCD